MFDFMGFLNMSKNKRFDGGSSSRSHGFDHNFKRVAEKHFMFDGPDQGSLEEIMKTNMEEPPFDEYSSKMDYRQAVQQFSDHGTASFRPTLSGCLASTSRNITKEHIDSRRLLAGKFPAQNNQHQHQHHLQTANSNLSLNFATASTHRCLDCHSLGSSSNDCDQHCRGSANGGRGKLGEGGCDGHTWRRKAEILAHPLCQQLFSTHISCLRAATPMDQLPRIDAQLEHSRQLFAKFSINNPLPLGNDSNNPLGGDELDKFMTRYVPLFSSFKDRLQRHVRLHTTACWELEQYIQSLTGVPLGESTGATMSDEDEDIDDLIKDIEASLNERSLDGPKGLGLGPLFPTESERSLIERVSQELKSELKEGYMERLVDIREEILRKRRAGKLPGNTASILKAWWMSHSKWPYPTEEDKARLVQETGLQLKQINNWFINQRKRNWKNNSSSSSSATKSKRKRSNAGETSCDNLM